MATELDVFVSRIEENFGGSVIAGKPLVAVHTFKVRRERQAPTLKWQVHRKSSNPRPASNRWEPDFKSYVAAPSKFHIPGQHEVF